MSLEQAVADLTAAVLANTAALTGKPADVKPGKPAKSAKEKTADAATAATGPTAKDAADAVLGLANDEKFGRDYAVKILAQFGVKRLSDLKPERYQEAIDAVKKQREAGPDKKAEDSSDSLV